MKSVDQDEVSRRARELAPLVEAEKKLAREWLLDDANGKHPVGEDSVLRLAKILAGVRWETRDADVRAVVGLADRYDVEACYAAADAIRLLSIKKDRCGFWLPRGSRLTILGPAEIGLFSLAEGESVELDGPTWVDLTDGSERAP